MLIVFLALVGFIGLMLLISVACEREVLRNEREEKPQHRQAA
jgi:hypothetical protein